MQKSLICAICALFVAGCASTPSYQKMQIDEPDSAIKVAKTMTANNAPEGIARQISDSFRAHPSAQADFNGARLVDVTSEGASAVYHFELSSKWGEMSPKNKENYLKSFQIVLANQACNSPSKRILLRYGVKFSHRFFYDDPASPLSSSDVDESFCLSKGL
ncbi:hypothetical protein OFO12_01600 [Campylobacter sp. JMF_04 NA10]|uniref:hypothetical protein n=1 Tax=Campylobacter sp. JMF_04 NA10 TaxID=2983824 RepID=UPI0022E9D814|nr:hypothetical protein [Campylobacter sp. JMF_04 NA10]MDA3076061.1 hypothetical protein [Campylobacter sp. JMF_04 NA10]